MCGVVGLFLPGARTDGAQLAAMAQRMADAVAHRGPDDAGVWVDPALPLALGHRRLAIVDLSAAGHQPMASHDGRWVAAFNGEIYNFPALRDELGRAGVGWRSHSDTEVLLAAVVHWGVVGALQRLAGMFAIALWDRHARELHLCRDRLGKKPLYVAPLPGGVGFASELKALWRADGFAPALSLPAVAGYFRYGYVAEDQCILDGVWKVRPGEHVRIDAGGVVARAPYWSLTDAVRRAKAAPLTDPAAAMDAVWQALRSATRERMVADVPLGAFLSGGIDSGLVVALMQEAGGTPTRSFSIGFDEASHDEAPVARAVARHLGTAHTELYVTHAQALATVPRLPEVFDEPFADASQIPTLLLASLARQHVTVALTGDGGDEAFGGYERYRHATGWPARLYRWPLPARRALAAGLAGVSPAGWDRLARAWPVRRRPRFPAQKADKLARALRASAGERDRLFLTLWGDEAPVLRGVADARSDRAFEADPALALASSEAMQFWECGHYLPGDLLVKLDRATMACGLEARCPLLDHRVVELAWRLPPALKAGPGALKHVLRELLFRHVPRELVDLPKQGFSVPLGPWLLGDLRSWAEDLFADGRRHLAGLLDWPLIDRAWQAQCAGRADHTARLWAVLMFVAWHRRWMRSAPP